MITNPIDVNKLEQHTNELYQENTRLNIRIKTLEDTLMKLNQKYSNIINNNNITSHQLQSNTFVYNWESICKVSLNDFFLPFFDNPYITYHLIQELLYISYSLIGNLLKNCTETLMQTLHIPLTPFNQTHINTFFNQLFQEYYDDIFENASYETTFYNEFIKLFSSFYKENFGLFKEAEFNELVSSGSLKNFLMLIKKMMLFILMKDGIGLDVFEFNKRRLEVREMKETECLLVQGKANVLRNGLVKCVVLCDVPKVKGTGVAYCNLKPWVMEVDDGYEMSQDLEVIGNTKQRMMTEGNDVSYGRKMLITERRKKHKNSYGNDTENGIGKIGKSSKQNEGNDGRIRCKSKPKTYKEIKLFENKLSLMGIGVKGISKKNTIQQLMTEISSEDVKDYTVSNDNNGLTVRKSHIKKSGLIENKYHLTNGRKKEGKAIKIIKHIIDP